MIEQQEQPGICLVSSGFARLAETRAFADGTAGDFDRETQGARYVAFFGKQGNSQ